MSYGLRFWSALAAVYFGAFLGTSLGNERNGQGNKQQHQPQGNHQLQRQSQGQQRQPQFNRGQQQQQNHQGQPQLHQRQQRPDHRLQQQPRQAPSVPASEQVRKPRDAEMRRRDIEKGPRGNDRRPGNFDRRPNNRRGNQTYRDWRGHRDFRPAFAHERYFRSRHQHFGRYFTHARYSTWRYRYNVFYGVYLPRPYVVYYDGINPHWIFWLNDYENHRYFARWVYHHRYEISVERYDALLGEYSWLLAELEQLERDRVHVDENYCPPGADEDMMYSEEYIEQYRQQ